MAGEDSCEMTTVPMLRGSVYARLRAEGLVSGDFEYQITGDATLVTVADRVYRLDGTGELQPAEG